MAENDGWKDLCRAIMVEKDPAKLMRLVEELNQELEARERELRRMPPPTNGSDLDSCRGLRIDFAL